MKFNQALNKRRNFKIRCTYTKKRIVTGRRVDEPTRRRARVLRLSFIIRNRTALKLIIVLLLDYTGSCILHLVILDPYSDILCSGRVSDEKAFGMLRSVFFFQSHFQVLYILLQKIKKNATNQTPPFKDTLQVSYPLKCVRTYPRLVKKFNHILVSMAN